MVTEKWKNQKETQQKKPGIFQEKNLKDQSHNYDYITRNELKDVINEVFISVQPLKSHRKLLIYYKCGAQGHFAYICKSKIKRKWNLDREAANFPSK